jgi:hypothetical protein
MFRRPLRLGWVLTVMAFGCLVSAVTAVALPHSAYIRYQSLQGTIYDHARWIYERIHFDDTPIDIAFVGSSRTYAGVIPALVEAALEKRGHGDLRVANLSLPASGFDIRYTTVRELLETRDVKLLVFSLVEAFPRDGHQAFGDLGTVGEILSSPWIVNRTLPQNVARLPMRQMRLALASAVPGAFGMDRDFDPARYSGASTPDGSEGKPVQTDEAHAKDLANESRMRKSEITPPILPESLSWIEFGVSQTYVKRIVALAEAHHTRVAFLFLPFFDGYEMPLEAHWVERYGPLWNADFMMHDPANYKDAAHGSANVTPAIADWLADHLLELLDTQTPGTTGQ